MSSTPFETALTSGSTAVTGYATTALPLVGGVAIAWLGVKYVRRIIKGF
jgi:hypothetical protein